MKKVSTHHQSFASNNHHPDQRMAPLLLSGTDSHFQQKLQAIKADGFKNREAEQSERDCQGIIASSDTEVNRDDEAEQRISMYLAEQEEFCQKITESERLDTDQPEE